MAFISFLAHLRVDLRGDDGRLVDVVGLDLLGPACQRGHGGGAAPAPKVEHAPAAGQGRVV